MPDRTATAGTQQVWLTQDAYSKLRNELDDLEGPLREEVVARIEEARSEGDLKENGGYHAAREEQGKQEARIRQLKQLLRDAQVGERPADAGDAATPGSVVTVRWAGDSDTERFLIGSREASVADLDIYSPSSPLGSAVLGHHPGETVTVAAPRGPMQVELVAVEPFAG